MANQLNLRFSGPSQLAPQVYTGEGLWRRHDTYISDDRIALHLQSRQGKKALRDLVAFVTRLVLEEGVTMVMFTPNVPNFVARIHRGFGTTQARFDLVGFVDAAQLIFASASKRIFSERIIWIAKWIEEVTRMARWSEVDNKSEGITEATAHVDDADRTNFRSSGRRNWRDETGDFLRFVWRCLPNDW